MVHQSGGGLLDADGSKPISTRSPLLMFSRSEDVEVHALFKRGWPISAIARHLECDRKTVSSYLNGQREPGVRRSSVPDPLAPFVGYVKARFVDDPHLWASALFDEVRPLGYRCSYPSFARQVRVAGLRPHCEACAGVRGRETVEIGHPAGEEIQWDWAAVSYTHLRAHETVLDLVCRLLLEKKKK